MTRSCRKTEYKLISDLWKKYHIFSAFSVSSFSKFYPGDLKSSSNFKMVKFTVSLVCLLLAAASYAEPSQFSAPSATLNFGLTSPFGVMNSLLSATPNSPKPAAESNNSANNTAAAADSPAAPANASSTAANKTAVTDRPQVDMEKLGNAVRDLYTNYISGNQSDFTDLINLFKHIWSGFIPKQVAQVIQPSLSLFVSGTTVGKAIAAFNAGLKEIANQ